MPFELWNTWKDSNINRWYARENNGKGNGASPTAEKIRYFGLKGGRIPVLYPWCIDKIPSYVGEKEWGKKCWGKYRGKMDGGKETRVLHGERKIISTARQAENQSEKSLRKLSQSSVSGLTCKRNSGLEGVSFARVYWDDFAVIFFFYLSFFFPFFPVFLPKTKTLFPCI